MWWSENPHFNVAIATGNLSGRIVVDVDGVEGEESLATLEKQFGTLPVTVTQITPGKMIDGQWTGKGRHLMFRTNGQQFSCRTGIVKNIDIKADGGYIVAAPSVHPDGTGSYTFADGLSFNGIESAELSQSWSTWILAEQEKKKSKAPVVHDLPSASEAIIEACRQEVAKIKPAIQGQGGDKKTFRVACLVFHDFGLSEAEGRPILEEYNRRCVPAWDERKLQHKIDSAVVHSGNKPRGWKRSERPIEGEYFPPFGAFVLNPSRTLPTALAFRRAMYHHTEDFTLRYYAGDFYRWSENHYQKMAPEVIRGTLLDWMTRAVMLKQDKTNPDGVTPVPFAAKSQAVNDAIDALKPVCLVNNTVNPGSWLGNDEMPLTIPPIFAKNCVYDWQTGTKHPCSPHWFNLSSLNTVIDDNPPEPTRWLRFLSELWGDDQTSKDLLHEFMGLCLTPDTSFNKMLLFVGPIRSGKGTIFRLMQAILGLENVATPTTDSLVHRFGLQSLLGKPLATIGDARFAGGDIQTAIERLLHITGEDSIDVDAKYRDPVSVKLTARLMVGSNEMPRLPDIAGAVASRCLVLQMTKSFLGCEDRGLDAALLLELPGIVKLMIEGLRRLHRQGFSQPVYHKEFIRDLEELGSPVRAFIRECCTVGSENKVASATLWDRWQQWCGKNEQPCGDTARFGRNLRTCCPEINRKRAEDGWYYAGIGLRQSLSTPPTLRLSTDAQWSQSGVGNGISVEAAV